ncbi:MAG TPA: YraN family protein [Sedimentibacter sp.]|nr:YraN family protein [Sedimentibacter sp.]HNZ82121.1 YraN family protein [Sedimentibacter sp.]HOH69600.1 YraN family protein [Sedimentibacter sp.]HPX00390.1 YraN family protein [Sedimentibacter sp.]HQB63524.1 YraN family protein [Sedimentibacter sp.]
MYNKNKGFEYEKIAEKYLLDKGFTILETNFTSKFGEIDIIAQKENRLHFIEVKGRKNAHYGYPGEAVTHTKQKRLKSAAGYYFMLKGKDDYPCQFDVIEIILESKELNHIENAFN